MKPLHDFLALALLFISTAPFVVCERKNVLFLVSDDMRPELGVYKESTAPGVVFPNIKTPNLDALAGRSLLLERAYVQQVILF